MPEISTRSSRDLSSRSQDSSLVQNSPPAPTHPRDAETAPDPAPVAGHCRDAAAPRDATFTRTPKPTSVNASKIPSLTVQQQPPQQQQSQLQQQTQLPRQHMRSPKKARSSQSNRVLPQTPERRRKSPKSPQISYRPSHHNRTDADVNFRAADRIRRAPEITSTHEFASRAPELTSRAPDVAPRAPEVGLRVRDARAPDVVSNASDMTSRVAGEFHDQADHLRY
jgi:hypothetical protein